MRDHAAARQEAAGHPPPPRARGAGALAAIAVWVCLGTSVGCGGQAHAQGHVAAPGAITVDLEASWLRRDWNRCASPAYWSYDQGRLVVGSDSTAVLFWQIPTVRGLAFDVGSNHKWLRKCEPPSYSFWADAAKEVKKANRALISVADYPVLTWRWRIERSGRVPGGDAGEPQVELGVTMATGGGNSVRELTYAWAPGRDIAHEVRRKTGVPGIYSFKQARFITESRPDSVGWTRQYRDVSADLRTALADKNLGQVLRVFIKVCPDTSRDSLKAHLADVRFLRAAVEIDGDTVADQDRPQ